MKTNKSELWGSTEISNYFIYAALALCVMDSKYIKKYEPYLTKGYTNAFLSILKKIPDNPTKSIFISVSKQPSAEHIPIHLIDEIFRLVDEFKTFSEDETKKLVKDILKSLKAQDNQKMLLQALQKAKEMIINGEVNEGIKTLKSIQFQSEIIAPSIAGTMITAVACPMGFPSGIAQIDNDTGGWLRGNMMALAGDSGSQKTMLSMWLSLQSLMANPEQRLLYFEKEMPITDVARRLVSHLLAIDSRELMRMTNKPLEHADEILRLVENIKSALGDVANPVADALQRFIPIEREMFKNAADMWEIVETYKADMWVLDFATMLEPESGTIDDNSMRHEFVTLKAMLENTNTFGIVLSQLKQSNGVDGRANKIPLIGDMEWGKHLRQFASWIFSIFYPSYYGYNKPRDWFYMVSRKTRHGGGLVIPLLSYPEYCDFTEPDDLTKMAMKDYYHSYTTNQNAR